MKLQLVIAITFSIWLFLVSAGNCQIPHLNAHAHNDYDHPHPFFDAVTNLFNSVEADVHLKRNKLLVAHNFAAGHLPTLEQLYLKPLDSLIRKNKGCVYPCMKSTQKPFFLMIDVKTNAETTYVAIKSAISKYPSLNDTGAIRIFLSGNRAINLIIKENEKIIGIDGRPDDLGKGYSSELMPVVSDHFKNWSHWDGESKPDTNDLKEIKALADRVHAERKQLRLWAIPDQEFAWTYLLEAGVDLISTDHLKELNDFLTRKGL